MRRQPKREARAAPSANRRSPRCWKAGTLPMEQ